MVKRASVLHLLTGLVAVLGIISLVFSCVMAAVAGFVLAFPTARSWPAIESLLVTCFLLFVAGLGCLTVDVIVSDHLAKGVEKTP